MLLLFQLLLIIREEMHRVNEKGYQKKTMRNSRYLLRNSSNSLNSCIIKPLERILFGKI